MPKKAITYDMKRILIGTVCFVLIALVSFFILKRAAPEKVYIKTLKSNRFQLIVNKRPYIIRGVVYAPVPIGTNHSHDFWGDPLKPHLYDGKLMKAMGANTIRVYQPGNNPSNTKKLIKELYRKFGIRTAIGHWFGFWDNPNYADPAFRESVKKDVLEMVRTYKDAEGILCWVLGNENNVSFFQGPGTINFWTTKEIEALGDPYLKRLERAKIYYSLVNEVAQLIHKIDRNHPVVLANKELDDIEAAADMTPDMDILGCSLYRGKTFGSFFREVATKFKRPVLITEFGCDRYNAFLQKEDPDIQAEFIEAQWKAIEENTFKGNSVGNSLGGFVFEWTDEWWKYNEDNTAGWGVHDTEASWSNVGYYFDIKAEANFNVNEEWWGICALEKRSQSLDERIPSKAYFVLKELWR